MSAYIPLLAGLFTLLVFLTTTPDGTCGALQTAGACSCRMVAGWVRTGRRPANRIPAMLSFQGHSMKIKLWQWEYDFDKEDAKIVVPLILLVLGLVFTPLRKDALWGGAVAYYLLYFFLPPCLLALKELSARVRHRFAFRCPYCKSREVILQGYEGYHSDEQYAYHFCNRCRETSILVNDRLIKSERH